jgi:hypothetical protein
LPRRSPTPTPASPGITRSPNAADDESAHRLRAALPIAGNHSGLPCPTAVEIGPTARAIVSGAAENLACIAGSPSHAMNAAPSRRTSGSSAHIHPNPRGSRASGGSNPRSPRAPSPRESLWRDRRPGRSSSSPVSIRRMTVESARSLARIQSRAAPRSTGEIACALGAEAPAAIRRTRSATGRATRRTTAFTRCSKVERSGAENIFCVLF